MCKKHYCFIAATAVPAAITFTVGKGKRTLDTEPLNEPHLRSAQYGTHCQWISQFYRHTPAFIHAFAFLAETGPHLEVSKV